MYPMEELGSADGVGNLAGESFRVGESPSGMGVDDAFQSHQENFSGAMRVLRAPAVCSVRRMSGGVAPDHYGAPRVELELLVSTYCITGSDDNLFYPLQKLRVIVDDVKAPEAGGHGFLPRSKWSYLLLRIVSQDAMTKF